MSVGVEPTVFYVYQRVSLVSAVLNQVFLFVLCSFIQSLPPASILLSCFHIPFTFCFVG